VTVVVLVVVVVVGRDVLVVLAVDVLRACSNALCRSFVF